MACFGILFLEMWLLMRLRNDRRPLNQVFGIDPPLPKDPGAVRVPRALPIPAIALLILTVIAIVPAQSLPNRVETPPERVAFSAFPLEVAQWRGRSETMESIYLDALKLTDYAMINFRTDNDPRAINFYVDYYASQRTSQSAHSRKSCLPGSGWGEEAVAQEKIGGEAGGVARGTVNRRLVLYGESRTPAD